jgi:pyruvate kinase
MRRTKIVCTIGPASSTEEMMTKLAKAGMNVARLNFSHGDHETHLANIKRIRNINEKNAWHIGIMLDTKGPEIRVGRMENDSVAFTTGDKVTVTNEDVVGNHERFHIECPELYKDISVNDRILINDGKLTMKVIKTNGKDEMVCEIANSGPIMTRKGVNVPNVKLSMPFISKKDEDDLRFGAQNNIDFVAASFVRRPEDVLAIRNILTEENHPEIEIVAKIENQEGMDNLEQILKVADGVMVARGDLGVEVSFNLVPIYQKKIIKTANKMGKPVITATHMLESMVSNPRPTRAEASDVANAVFDGTDCVMLSAESAAGQYPVEAVTTMASIVEECEKNFPYARYLDEAIDNTDRSMSDAIGISVAESCLTMQNISAIMAFTETGGTPKRLSKYKPCAPIIAATNSLRTCRHMSIYSDVVPVYAPNIIDSDLYDATAHRVSVEMGLPVGSTYIITAGWHSGHGNTNTMRFAEVENN